MEQPSPPPCTEVLSPVAHSLFNLKAYRRAQKLASSTFWGTRRPPRHVRHPVVRALRRQTATVLRHLERAWYSRHDVYVYRRRLRDALHGCSRFQHWLRVAAAHDFVTEEVGAQLHADACDLYRLILRLRQRPAPSGRDAC